MSLWEEEKKQKPILWIAHHSPNASIFGYVNTILKAHFEGTQDASHTFSTPDSICIPLWIKNYYLIW